MGTSILLVIFHDYESRDGFHNAIIARVLGKLDIRVLAARFDECIVAERGAHRPVPVYGVVPTTGFRERSVVSIALGTAAAGLVWLAVVAFVAIADNFGDESGHGKLYVKLDYVRHWCKLDISV
jgi:hypothetical protein